MNDILKKLPEENEDQYIWKVGVHGWRAGLKNRERWFDSTPSHQTTDSLEIIGMLNRMPATWSGIMDNRDRG